MKFSITITQDGITISGDVEQAKRKKAYVLTEKGKRARKVKKILKSAAKDSIHVTNASLSKLRRQCLECETSFPIPLDKKGHPIARAHFCSPACRDKFMIKPKTLRDAQKAAHKMKYGKKRPAKKRARSLKNVSSNQPVE